MIVRPKRLGGGTLVGFLTAMGVMAGEDMRAGLLRAVRRRLLVTLSRRCGAPELNPPEGPQTGLSGAQTRRAQGGHRKGRPTRWCR